MKYPRTEYLRHNGGSRSGHHVRLQSAEYANIKTVSMDAGYTADGIIITCKE
jgi:hypothetical protein